MSKIIAIANHKGGVGKTTSAINIGAGLNLLGKSVLLVDLDPQASLSQSLNVTDPDKDIYGSLRGKYPLHPYPILKGLDIIPSCLDLSGAEIELAGEAGREYILKELLEPLSYDYIIIDSPPSLSLLTLNALTAAQDVLIPLQAEFLALRGLAKLRDVIEKIKKRLNKDLQITAVFVTCFDSRRVLNRNVVQSIQEYFPQEFLTTKIRQNIALAEAPVQGLDIFRYAEKSNGAMDYMELCKELLTRITE
jgi:chromosome partitioning protein